MDNTEACIALNMLSGMGPVRMQRLLTRFGSPSDILSARPTDLCQVQGIGTEMANTITHWQDTVNLQEELALIAHHGAEVITRESKCYPRALKEIHDPPIVLYVKGTLLPADTNAIAIVGTRQPSHYGQEAAKKLSYQLAYSGLTVVSGLARGIDALAHTGAIAAKGRTIAVLGSGLASLYPAENRELASRIIAQGAVISEFPMRRKPDRQTFPIRNRIVSGMTFGTLVVECGIRSGAMITANQAGEQGRSLYAVPAPIDRPSSQGCNRLIQQGARLVMSAADVLDEMQTLFAHPPELETSRPAIALSAIEEKIYTSIGEAETPIDHIIKKSGLPSGDVSSTLLTLEMKRVVKQLPGKHFVKLI